MLLTFQFDTEKDNPETIIAFFSGLRNENIESSPCVDVQVVTSIKPRRTRKGKLSSSDVHEIREYGKHGNDWKAIGLKYNINPQYACAIANERARIYD